MGIDGGAGIVGPVQEIWPQLSPSLASTLESGLEEEQRPSLFGDWEVIMDVKGPFCWMR